MSAYTDFKSDPQRIEVWLFEVEGFDPATGDSATYYFSSARYATEAGDTPANQRYDAMITRGFERSGAMNGTGPALAGLMPALVGGSIVLGQRLGDLDLGTLTQLGGLSIRDISFGGRAAVVRHGGYSPRLGRSLTYSEFKVVFTGTCDGNPQIGTDDVTFNLSTKDRSFEYPVQDRTFWGLGYGLLFDGTNDAIDCTNNAAHNFTSGDFTVEMPILFESNPAAEKTLLSRGSVSADGWALLLTTAGAAALRTNQSGANQVTVSEPITHTRWVWVSCVRDGAEVRFYIDGVLQVASSGTHINPTTASRTLYVGRSDAGGGTSFFNGLVGKVRIWNVARTQEEINETMHRALDASEIDATLVAYLKLDEGTGVTAADSSATNADGTISGATWVHSGTGHDDLTGQRLPDTWGPVYGWSPVLLDEVRRIYIVSSEAIDSFAAVHVGGAVNMTLDNAETSFLTFISTTTANGKYDTCITAGGTYIRLGSNPTKALTVDVLGNAPGGTYLENAADQIYYITANRGPAPLVDPTDFDTASFTALESDNAAAIGHAWDSNPSVADVIGFILRTVGAVGYFKRDTGLFAVERVEGLASKSPTLTLTQYDVAKGTLQVLDRMNPISNVLLHYKRNYTLMGSGDILPGVAGTERERFVKREWREAQWLSKKVANEFLNSSVLEFETGFQERSDALAEANRLGALFDTPDQAFRFLCKRRSVELDRMDGVYFHYQDFDRFGAPQSRFGTSTTAKFLVLETSDDVDSGGVWLTLWREEV